jgi:colicin import membrane protein
MARVGISYEQVAAAADALVGEGQSNPTINAIRERLGTGSPNTIHRHLTAWNEARPQVPAPAPVLPASLATAIATEIGRAAAQARLEIEEKLVQSHDETNVLAKVGEALEAENSALVDQVIALTTERDQALALATDRAAEITRQAQELARERNAAEQARIEVAQNRNKLDGQIEKLGEQKNEIDQLRKALEMSQDARQQAEKLVAQAEKLADVATAKLESMTERATKAETRLDQLEEKLQQVTQELNSATAQLASQQIKEAQAEAKNALEEVAELRSRLVTATPAAE